MVYDPLQDNQEQEISPCSNTQQLASDIEDLTGDKASSDTPVEISYDSIFAKFMESYRTADNFLRAFGGPVSSSEAALTEYGQLSVAFSRPVVYPAALLADLDPAYTEEVPELVPSKNELEEIQSLFDQAVEEAEALAKQKAEEDKAPVASRDICSAGDPTTGGALRRLSRALSPAGEPFDRAKADLSRSLKDRISIEIAEWRDIATKAAKPGFSVKPDDGIVFKNLLLVSDIQ